MLTKRKYFLKKTHGSRLPFLKSTMKFTANLESYYNCCETGETTLIHHFHY